MSSSLFEELADAAGQADAPALLRADGSVACTYADLYSGSARLANAMLARGVVPGDRVAVQVGKSTRALMLYLACLRAGFIYLPLNLAYRRGELAHFLQDASPALFVSDPANATQVRELAQAHARRCQVVELDADGGGVFGAEADCAAPDAPIHPAARDDVASLIYTSGTTGRPKGVMLTHGNLASNARTLHRVWGWRPGDVLLHALPIFHVHGLFVASHCALLNGSPMYFLAAFDARTVLALLPRCTVMMGVPTFYSRLLAEPGLDRAACAGMRLFISGSAPLLEETFHAFRERTGHAILERYGMSETGMNTSNPIAGDRIAGTVGLPLPEVEVRVADDADRALGTGETGQIHVRGPNVFRGYWGMPGRTSADFAPGGWFRTGDLGRIDANGYVSIVGRAKDLVITGGYNVYPKEVELVLDRLPGVGESAVFGVPHADFGEAVTAVVVPRPGGPRPDPGALVAQARAELAGYKVPRRIVVLDELPRNAMGKVQKNVLRERFSSRDP